MNVAVVKDLATRHTKEELNQAIEALENRRENILDVQGTDDGDRLSNLLVACRVRSKLDEGMNINDALREHSQRVRSIFGSAKPPVKKS